MRAAAAARSGEGSPSTLDPSDEAALGEAGFGPHLAVATFLQPKSSDASYQLLLWVSEQALCRLKVPSGEAPPPAALRAAVVSLITLLEEAKPSTPAEDRMKALLSCATEQEAQARALAFPRSPAASSADERADGADGAELLQLRLLHSAAEFAARAVLIHTVLGAMLSDGGAAAIAASANAGRESAETTRGWLESAIARLEEAAAIAVCARAQAWLDGEVRGDEHELMQELEKLELEASANAGAID